MMNQIIQDRFIPQQLLYFIAGRRCCQQFSCAFRNSEHNVFINCARSLGLRSQCVYTDGQGCIKIYKRLCKHYLEEPKTLHLCNSTIVDMFTLLSRTGFVGSVDDLQMSADYVGHRHSCVVVPLRHLPLAPLRPPPLRFRLENQREFLKTFSGFPSRHDLLETLYVHRVVVFDAQLSWDKSVFVPLIILEDCEIKKASMKIFCIERDNILAIHNSERTADFFGEDVGETVAIQIPHRCSISTISHIIYTTATHFLRSLISLSSADKFRHISHVVVSDAHLHDPYTDILLSELHSALELNQNLRVILLSESAEPQQFVTFFGEGTVVCMDRQEPAGHHIAYLDDIHSCISLAGISKGPGIVYKDLPQLFRDKSQRNYQMDKCLQAYEELGTDAAFRPFLYAINYELVPVNYQHSLNGKTAVLIAAKLNNAKHLRLLLFMGADPYIVDEQHHNAITFAAFKGNSECIDILNNYSLHGYVIKNAKPEFVDFDLMIDIMYLICTKPEFHTGNILIILPTYYHLVKLNYMLLSHCLTGKLQELSIFLLHRQMSSEYVEALFKARSDTIKVVLATDVVESLPLPIAFKYVIDTACEKKTIYDNVSYTNEDKYEWVALDCLARRALLLDPDATDAQCFRLITKDTYNHLDKMCTPAIQTAPLDKICLTVKLLCPNKMISEYLSFTIASPPLINVHHTVQFLKKIDVLDETEDVTWLGCRLLDLPVPCQLGRTLIFGILLQCLDPILTIVSSMCSTDPLNLPFSHEIEHLWDRFTMFIQNRIKVERARLAENQYSDHFVYVRLFQEWQSRLRNNVPPLHLKDEYDFVLNGLMEELNITRSNIVSALRAANLVHCHGILSMQSVNVKSSSWPIVKAALTGGLYPNLCAVDEKLDCLKSAHSKYVYMHPNTVLRDFLEPFNKCVQKFQTPWIVCSKRKNHIVYSTVVVPLAVAMFAGSTKLRYAQFFEFQSPLNDRNTNLFFDEWIWMVMSKSLVELIVKTRQYFFRVYHDFLKHCGDPEKWRRDTKAVAQYPILIEMLTKIFENEEVAAGFNRSNTNIGYRPVVKMPNLFLLSINSHFSWDQELDDAATIPRRSTQFDLNSHFVERQFFLLHTTDSPNHFYQNSSKTYIDSVLGKFARPIESSNRHIFVILYGKKPDIMYSISRAQTIKGEFVLKEYFRNEIPVSEILKACGSMNVSVPSFDERLISSLIDKRVGNLIMDLFAFRNHWIYK